MSDAPFGRIASFYDELVETHGDDVRSCDYGRPESQLKKFEVLADVTDLRGKRVLDVGCGFAHYADYLEKRYGDVSYTGIDLSPRMIEIARRRRPDLDLAVANVLELDSGSPFDVVNANGIFYLLGDDADGLMQQLLVAMWSLAGEALAVNSLSTRAPHRQADEFQADPDAVLEFAHTLSPRATLRHDYLPHDFTLYVYRTARP